MPEFMTNLRAACLKLRGGVGNSGLLNPDLFRYGRFYFILLVYTVQVF